MPNFGAVRIAPCKYFLSIKSTKKGRRQTTAFEQSFGLFCEYIRYFAVIRQPRNLILPPQFSLRTHVIYERIFG